MRWAESITIQKRAFSHEEIVSSIKENRKQRSVWRWVMLGTLSTHEYARSQIFVIQCAYVLGISLIFLAETVAPTIDRTLLNIWLAEGIANLVFRMSLFAKLMNQPDPSVASKPLWRLVPPFNAFVVGCHWAWTAWIFVGPTLTATTVTTLVVFILMSISTMTIAPASPLAAAVYLLFLWIPMSLALVQAEWVGSNMVIVLLVGVVGVLSVSLWLTVGPVWRYLAKSDEVELLVEELRGKNVELEQLRAIATAELSARSQFFSGASHDFKQRLHAMKLLAHAAREGARAGAAPTLERLGSAVDDLEHYVHDVLEFARLESRALTPVRRDVALQDVFQTLAVEFEDVAAARGVDLRFRTTEAHIETDESMLLRIMQNVISNAVKFTRKHVLVAARPRGSGWSIEVWDQGPGIEPGSEERIFEAFYQSRVYVDQQQEGVGLGLAIVRRLADCLGYAVQLRSVQGKGSVMKVVIAATEGRNQDDSANQRQAIGAG